MSDHNKYNKTGRTARGDDRKGGFNPRENRGKPPKPRDFKPADGFSPAEEDSDYIIGRNPVIEALKSGRQLDLLRHYGGSANH